MGVRACCVFVFQLKETLQGLPQSLSLLVQSSLERLCNQYRDIPGLRLSLAALAVSKNGKVLQHVIINNKSINHTIN